MGSLFWCCFGFKDVEENNATGSHATGSNKINPQNTEIRNQEGTSALLVPPANNGLPLLNSNSAFKTAAAITASQPHLQQDREANDTNQLEHKNAERDETITDKVGTNKDNSPDAKVEDGFSYMFASHDDEDVCPTCLEEYTCDNPRILARCNHHYHLGCIYDWKERSETCPVCAKVLVFDEAF